MRCLAAILACCLLTAAAAQTAPAPEKYQKVFYPQGMPLRQDPFGPEKLITAYRYYSEARLPDKRVAVLYSEQTLPEPLADTKFWVFVGILERTRGRLRVLATREVTEFFPVNLEQPGTFHAMAGRLNYFPISPRDPGLHLNLWSVLAGAGATSGASDLFFRIFPDSSLEPMLELKQSSYHTHEGAGLETAADTQLWTADTDGDGVMEVAAQEKVVRLEGGKRRLRRPAARLYKLVEGKYQPVPGLIKVDLPASAVSLRRSSRIPKATVRR